MGLLVESVAIQGRNDIKRLLRSLTKEKRLKIKITLFRGTQTVLHTISFTNSCLLRILTQLFTYNCVLKVPRRVHPTGFERLQRHQLSEAARLREALL